MKILILIQCTNLGGMEQSTLLFIQELIRLGISVDVLSINEVGEIGDALRRAGAHVTGVGYRGRFGWRSFADVRKALRASNADHVLMVGHNLMAMLAIGARWRGKKVLSLHFHHKGVMSRWSWRLIYALAVCQFKAIIFPSRFIYAEAIDIAPWIRARSNVISFPIPVHAIRDANEQTDARRRLALDVGAFYVGNAGWLISRKRWDVFLRVCALVAARVDNARFLIAGDGPERVRLESLARELGISDKVVWMGWLKGLDDFYKSLDVMLFNSDWDAMGRTPLEAMSHGVPTVASVINGGLGEMISQKEMGFFISEHDVESMAAEIVLIAKKPQMRQQYEAGGNKRIRDVGSAKLHTIRVLLSMGVEIPNWYLDEPDFQKES